MLILNCGFVDLTRPPSVYGFNIIYKIENVNCSFGLCQVLRWLKWNPRPPPHLQLFHNPPCIRRVLRADVKPDPRIEPFGRGFIFWGTGVIPRVNDIGWQGFILTLAIKWWVRLIDFSVPLAFHCHHCCHPVLHTLCRWAIGKPNSDSTRWAQRLLH